MGVTIDSLQIEIQSSSTNAAEGINALAKSLGELKKNGAFKTVTNNLNRLSDALNTFPNVHKAANALRTLSNSIEQLKNVGSVSGIATSLEKLPKALEGLEKIDFDRTAPLIDKVIATIGRLSTIKSGGLSSIVNGLSKLKEVSEKLDDDTIAEFGKKIDALNAKLGPLSQKMTSIKAGFSAISSESKKAAESVEDFGEGINASALNVSSFIDIINTAVGAIKQVVMWVANLMESAIQWDGIEYQFGNSFGSQADIYYDKITQITDALKINKQMFMENSAMAASMLIGFGVNAEDAREMGVGYTELAYDIWAAFNNVYKTLDGADGAMAAVRSAIAGEVEPIRRAGFTIVESQLEQTAANHGLKISIENATEAQKSYLRYLELVDQAHRKGIVGTYASEMEKAEGMVRTLKQQWISLTQSFASLFIPILTKVLPYIQAFVDLLKEGVYWLANLFNVDIQKVDFSDYKKGASAIEDVGNSAAGATDSLDDATKAAKELKNATLGIDELNVINPNTASSAGSNGSGVGDGADGFAGLDVSSLWDESILDTVKSDVAEITEKMRGWLPIIGAVAAGFLGLRLVKLFQDIKKIADTLKGVKDIKVFGNLIEFFKAAKQMAPEVGWMKALFPKMSVWFTNIGTALSGAGTTLSGFVASIGALVGGGVGAGLAIIAAAVIAVGSAVYFLYENWEEVKQAFKDFFADNIAPKLEEITKHFDKMKEALGPLYTDVLVPVIDWVKSIDLSAVGTAFEWLGGIVVGVVGGLLAGAFNGIMSFIEGVVQALSGLIQASRGLVDFIIGLITGDGQKISDGWKKIWTGIFEAVKGGYDATIGVVVEFVEGVIDWFVEMWDVLVGHSIVPDTINAIVKWFTSLPSKIFSSIDKFVSGIVDKFKGLWSKLVSWWNGKTKLKEYTPSIGSIYDKLKSRWDSARTWWNDKKTKAKEYTPSIGSIYEKLSDRWKNARDWWNNKKGSMSYTPSIGSIVDKVKSAWNSAKSWWNKNVSLSTKLDIKVPTISVKWSTAEAFGKSFKYPTGFSLKFAADGGIFDQGSLIWAGERGPEVMATAAGGKTGVMNVQQMQEAVYEGVFAAMSAAMRSNNGGGSEKVFKVYIDGREITSTVERHQSERGASLMGNEVYAY